MELLEKLNEIEKNQMKVIKGLRKNHEFSKLVQTVAYDNDASVREKCSEKIMQQMGISEAIEEVLDDYNHKFVLASVYELEGCYYGLTFVAIWIDNDAIKTRSLQFMYCDN